MFWRITGLSSVSPVESILDKENYTLEELLDEDEIIQECKALNSRLINFFRERTQVEKLLLYIVEEGPEDAEKKRTFKFPFIACEIFTCEVDIILKTLVEDEELMNLLFSFLKPDHSHSTQLAGYFSKVFICLMLRKTVPLMNYVQAHQEIFQQLVDLIGITSIMEVLIRLIGADDHTNSSYMDSMQWLEDVNVLEMIVDKFSSSDSPEVHANLAETLCAITRCAPPGLAAKISSPSFVGRLFCHALECSRPKSVLFNSLVVCISILDPKRLASASYHPFRSQLTYGSFATANTETVDGMLDSLGELLKLLDISSPESILATTYGCLQPPLGKLRLKIVDFISVLLTIGHEAAEKELIRLGAIHRILDLFFEYPFNNFLHHHVENIIGSCLESETSLLLEHILNDCNVVGKILEAEKNFTLSKEPKKPTMPADGRSPPRIGNIGHITRICNKLIQLGNDNNLIKTHLQENTEWVEWYTVVLLERNSVENVYLWKCGRPTALQEPTRDSDDEDKDRDYDIAALANNLNEALRRSIYSNDDVEEAHGSFEHDDKVQDVYFDDESAEVVISSLRLGDDQESSSLYTNSDWFAFEDDRVVNECATTALASPSSSSDETDEVIVDENGDLDATASSQMPGSETDSVKRENSPLENGSMETEKGDLLSNGEIEKAPEWVEWRETSDSGDVHDLGPTVAMPNGELGVKSHVAFEEESLPPSGTAEGKRNEGGSDDGLSEDPLESSNGNQVINTHEKTKLGTADSDPEHSSEPAETVVVQCASEDMAIENKKEENGDEKRNAVSFAVCF